MSHGILIIEDDPALLRGLTDNFTAAGYKVVSAADGESGLAAALDSPPDLLVLDLMLPKVNGYEICRAIREKGLEFPILMLTAKSQEEDIVLGLNLGADDYVSKPFRVKEVVARVKALLRRGLAQKESVIRFGDFQLDTGSRRLLRAGVEVPLTSKEYKLLEYFARSAGRALTRDRILDAVWGNSVIVTARSVDRCVTTLRAKIESDPKDPAYIQTVRDIGYRFEA